MGERNEAALRFRQNSRPWLRQLHTSEQIVRKVVEEMSLEAEIVKVTDHNDVIKSNILSISVLVINEKLISAGKIPSNQQLLEWLEQD